jgi:prolyl-tRNA synthetase
MAHSDDKGLVLPPVIAPIHVMIVPIWKTEEEKKKVSDYIDSIIPTQVHKFTRRLGAQFHIDGNALTYEVDIIYKVDRDDQKTMGRKLNQYQLQ